MSDDDQDELSRLEQTFRTMLDRCAESPEHRTTVFSVCLTLIDQLAVGQPIAVRQAWATKLYELADHLAAKNDAV
ncbi:MAG: hypothetical protein R3F54_26200 [Alphaproteobacteria bacterium]